MGQKLEAAELKPKHFTGVLLPATVIDVDGDTISIHFDGYPPGQGLKVRDNLNLIIRVE